MLDLLENRHSVRSFTVEPLSQSVIDRLKSEATYINSHEAGLNFQLVFNDSTPFAGFRQSYGIFRNVRNYLAVVIDPTFPDTYERAGYFAQQFVVEALKLNLGTCYVGATFSKNHIQPRMEVYEKLPFVIALGFPDVDKTSLIGNLTSRLAHFKKRKPVDFFDGSEDEYNRAKSLFPWIDDALRAVACAPSSLNRQPVRLALKSVDGSDCIVAYTVDGNKSAVDLGIAKFNVASVVQGIWDFGQYAPFYPDTD